MGVKAPRQPRLSNGGIQQIVVRGCVHDHSNTELTGTFLLRATIAIKPEENTSQVIAFQEIVVGMAAREGIKAKQRREQTVRPRSMIGRRAARQKRLHYDPFAGGTVFWTFVSSNFIFILFLQWFCRR